MKWRTKGEKGNTMPLESAIRRLRRECEAAVKYEWVRNPVAYALYQVWKQADGEKKDDE